MNIYCRLAWRNIWRNKRRTLLTTAAIAFSVFVTINVLALSDGCHWAMIRSSLNLFSGHLQIHQSSEPEVTMEEVLNWDLLVRRLKRSSKVSRELEKLLSSLEPSKKEQAGRYVLNYEEKVEILEQINSFQGSYADELNQRKELDELLSNALAPYGSKSYEKEPLLDKCFEASRTLLETLSTTPSMKAYTKRLQTACLIANEKNSVGGLVVGIEAAKEAQVTTLDERLIQGEFLGSQQEKSCLIGTRMAKSLDLCLGDDLVILGQALDGSTAAARLRVKGILKLGSAQFERSLLLVPLAYLQTILRCEGKVHTILCRLDSPRSHEEAKAYIGKRMDHSRYTVLAWPELLPELIEFIELDNAFGYVFLSILLIVVVFGILSAVFTSVLERTPEFGLMLSLGTKPGQILLLVLFETLFLSALGTMLGLLLGLPLAYTMEDNPIDLPSSSADIWSAYGVSENKLWFEVRPTKVFILTLFLVSMAALFSLYPAWRAARLRPDEALRSVRE